jgi:hypothetical protein
MGGVKLISSCSGLTGAPIMRRSPILAGGYSTRTDLTKTNQDEQQGPSTCVWWRPVPLTRFNSKKELPMLFCAKVDTATIGTTGGKICPEGGSRLPASTADTGKIRLGGGFRLPLANA